MHMRSDSKSDAAKKIVDDADTTLKTLRQNAVKDIHATSACAKAENDDEDANEQDNDNDENDDNDKSEKSGKSEDHSERNFLVVLLGNLFGNNTNTTSTNTTLTTTGDPKAIADAAVAAMKLVFDDATAKLQALPSPSPRATKSPRPLLPDNKGKSDHGKGSDHSGRDGGDD